MICQSEFISDSKLNYYVWKCVISPVIVLECRYEECGNVIMKKCYFDEKYTLDFTNSKARFVTKSPRDKSDKIIKTQLKFLESEIFWMRRIDIDKI